MPIFAKNIIVGGTAPPTVVNEQSTNIGPKFKVFGKFINKSEPEPIQKEIFEPKKPEVIEKKKIEVVEVKDESKYLYKQDGDLIRHINKKSSYLRDILEIE
jgi:hypothetical protein